MKNKSVTYSSTAFIATFVMCGWDNFLHYLVNDQTDILLQSKLCLVLLQVVLVIKYVAGTLLVAPAKIDIRQFGAGFLLADMVLAINAIWFKDLLAFPQAIMIGQVLVLAFYVLMNKRHFKGANISFGVSTDKLMFE